MRAAAAGVSCKYGKGRNGKTLAPLGTPNQQRPELRRREIRENREAARRASPERASGAASSMFPGCHDQITSLSVFVILSGSWQWFCDLMLKCLSVLGLPGSKLQGEHGICRACDCKK